MKHLTLVLSQYRRKEDGEDNARYTVPLVHIASLPDANRIAPGDFRPLLFVLHCTVPYSTVLRRTPLYCTVVYCTVFYCSVLFCTVLYCTLLYCTVLYCTLYCTVLYCTVLYCTVLYCTVMYCTVLCCVRKTKSCQLCHRGFRLPYTMVYCRSHVRILRVLVC